MFRFILEIGARLQADVDASGDNPDRDMWCLKSAARPRDGARFDCVENKFARVHVAGRAAPAGEVGVGLPARFVGRGKQAGGVGLPDLDHRIAQGRAGSIVNGSLQHDLFAFTGPVFIAVPRSSP